MPFKVEDANNMFRNRNQQMVGDIKAPQPANTKPVSQPLMEGARRFAEKRKELGFTNVKRFQARRQL